MIVIRKNFGPKPMCYPMPVCIIGTYDPMNHHYLILGEKVGQAFFDGLVLK